ncbi:MAG: long-chain-fatty-acid--CoA ligase [Proteobacteria bacterium]|nr:MAG: long-chain-fatty-acid--CoA ligase [Pseudomonadota bacterium]
MEKIWLSSYPQGVDPEIDLSSYSSLNDLVAKSVGKFGDRPAYENMGKQITYQELDRLATQFASYLTHVAGMKKGDRIAIMLPNLLQYPVALFGALRAGLIVVNTNPLYTDRELEHQLKDSGAKAIIILENFAHTLSDVIDHTPVKTVITTQLADFLDFPKSLLVNIVVKYIKRMVPKFNLPTAVKLKTVLAEGDKYPFQEAEVGHEDIAFLQYTGGTTGVAKGAALTHRNMLANLLQAHTWAASELHEGQELSITALPLYHIFALTANALFSMKLGANSLLITNPRDMKGFVKTLKGRRFSSITGVNTLFNGLIHTSGFESLDFSNLRLSLGGGMAVQRYVAEEWKRITGCTLVEAYGLTESSPAVCINPVDLKEFNGAIGLPLPSTEVCIRDAEGVELGLNEPGELCVRGPQVMKGYWNRPDETANVLDADGWLRTGDVAEIDEQGFVRIVDRLKDMIIVSGFNVYPNEIEDVAASHAKVLEAGVVGVPDEKSGEAVKLFVVPSDEGLTKKELKDYLHHELTGYKRPKQIIITDELPKSNVGKILRRELRDRDA